MKSPARTGVRVAITGALLHPASRVQHGRFQTQSNELLWCELVIARKGPFFPEIRGGQTQGVKRFAFSRMLVPKTKISFSIFSPLETLPVAQALLPVPKGLPMQPVKHRHSCVCLGLTDAARKAQALLPVPRGLPVQRVKHRHSCLCLGAYRCSA